MGRLKRGFTLVEVALFLAVTGALFVGVTIGVQNSIFQQRYNDSVQNFVEFLRRVYSGVSNVQSLGTGRSEKAIYGKLVTFGESEDLAGNSVNGEGEKNSIFVYDVIGDIGDIESGNTLAALSELNAGVTIMEDGEVKPVGVVEDYTPRWAAQIEETGSYDAMEGMLLVVRHPRSGTIHTYFTDQVVNVNERIRQMNNNLSAGLDVGSVDVIDWGAVGFRAERVDFCVNPNGDERSRLRMDVRLAAGARNSSAIETISFDGNGYKCGVSE